MSKDYIVRLIRKADSRRRWREDRKTAEQILKQRQERYATDPLYREKIKSAVKRRREEKEPSDRKRSFNRDKMIVLDGVSVRLLSSGKAAKAMGVSPKTLQSWERKGYIPINRIKDDIGRRWYPVEFVRFMAIHTGDRPKGRLSGWSSQVKEDWQSIQLSDNPIPVVGDQFEDTDG